MLDSQGLFEKAPDYWRGVTEFFAKLPPKHRNPRGLYVEQLDPEMFRMQMSALYNFIYMKLVDANTEHQIAKLDEALNLLRYQRETWTMLLEQLGKTKAAAAATTLDMPAPDARMEASIKISA